MKREDIITVISPQTKFKEIEFIRKDALLDWINLQKSFEQGFESGDSEYGYKLALYDLIIYLNKTED